VESCVFFFFRDCLISFFITGILFIGEEAGSQRQRCQWSQSTGSLHLAWGTVMGRLCHWGCSQIHLKRDISHRRLSSLQMSRLERLVLKVFSEKISGLQNSHILKPGGLQTIVKTSKKKLNLSTIKGTWLTSFLSEKDRQKPMKAASFFLK